MFLPANVVHLLHGQMVCQQTGPETTRGVAEGCGSLSHVQITILCLGCATSQTQQCTTIINFILQFINVYIKVATHSTV